MKTKLIALLLLVSMVLAVFVGCKNNTTVGGDSTQTDTSKDNANDVFADNLPSNMDFGGQKIVIHGMTRNDVGLIEENDTDIIRGEIHRREIKTEERLKVDIEPYVPYGWTQYSMAINEIRLSVAGDMDDFQLIAGWSALIPALSLEGVFMNFLDSSMSNVDLEQPYWVQTLVDGLTVGDKLFFVTGDISYTAIAMAFVIAVNNDLVQDYNVPNLPALVKDNKWTIEKMGEVAKMVSGGPDGDTSGFYLDGNFQDVATAFMQGSNMSLVSRDEDGLPYLNTNTEKMATLVNKVYDLFFETEGVKIKPTVNGYDTVFPQGKAMLYPSYVDWFTNFFRDMENKSVLPWPKYDEAQSQHYTAVQSGISLWSVPTTVVTAGQLEHEDRLQATTATLEALASYSYKNVTPATFEEALKTKYNDDPDAPEMLDIAKKGILLNFEIIYTAEIGGAWTILNELMYNKDNDFASLWEERAPVIEGKIVDFIDTFSRMD